jgi:hypothetical protein
VGHDVDDDVSLGTSFPSLLWFLEILWGYGAEREYEQMGFLISS